MAEIKTFRTEVPTRKGVTSIGPGDTAVFLGSCFAENISKKLADGLMDCWSNPYGTAYNPLSVGEQLEKIIERRECSDGEIFKNGDYYYSWLAHTKLRALSKAELKEKIDSKTEKMHLAAKKAALIVITFGTSWVYRLKESGAIVANCHKVPQDAFERERISVEEISERWGKTLKALREINPGVHVVMTVSPIRHIKETMHGNQLSKATLLEAVDRIVKRDGNASYFDAYEIMLDELRDYRFYAEDMVHPSMAAIEYIYERFGEAYMSEEARQMVREGQKLTMAAGHRPIEGGTGNEEYETFRKETARKVEEFRKKYGIDEGRESIKKVLEILNVIK